MKVLFVCTCNQFRSVGAELFARESRPDLNVFSRGTDASQNIPGPVKEELEARNIADSSAYDPTEIRGKDLEEADLVVAMTSKHTEFIEEKFETDTQVVNWNVPDVDPDQHEEEELKRKISDTYDIIEKKVEEL